MHEEQYIFDVNFLDCSLRKEDRNRRVSSTFYLKEEQQTSIKVVTNPTGSGGGHNFHSRYYLSLYLLEETEEESRYLYYKSVALSLFLVLTADFLIPIL
jgi:hypothetical protein